MSLTRNFLKGLGITDEQISAIIEAHTESTDALKEQRDTFKKEAETLKAEKAEHDNFATGENEWKTKFETVNAEFEKFKADTTASETKRAKEKAYSSILSTLGINEKRANSILKLTDLNSIELNEDGTIKDAETLSNSLKTEWAEFIPSSQTSGTNTSVPPEVNTEHVDLDKMSMADYIAYRQKK